jgi:predicted Zn-ribbon and HTH transcriptional regulator
LNDRFQLTKIEGQIWIALYELLLNPQCCTKYEYTEYKKNQILKLRMHMNEILIDQIPNLGVLQRFLEQLAISQPPSATSANKSDLIIEQVSEIYDSIMSRMKGKGSWKDLAIKQAKSVLDPSDSEIIENAKRWADIYNQSVLENLILNEPTKCAECGAEESKNKCSRCKSEFYCRRECQVKHWPKHKKSCDMIVDAIKKSST